MNETLRMVLTLTIVCVFSAVSLALVYEKTSPIIQENKVRELNSALKKVLPDAENFEEIYPALSGNIKRVFKGLKNNEVIGYAFLSEAPGFQSFIKVLLGTDKEKITKVVVIEHLETPGLGERITEDDFLSQFRDKSMDYQKFDTITGATISSSAVISSVKETEDYITQMIGSLK